MNTFYVRDGIPTDLDLTLGTWWNSSSYETIYCGIDWNTSCQIYNITDFSESRCDCVIPTQSPTNTPTISPTIAPTFNPTLYPTSSPSTAPSKAPTDTICDQVIQTPQTNSVCYF